MVESPETPLASCTKLRLTRAHPRAKAAPAWILDSPREPPLTGRKKNPPRPRASYAKAQPLAWPQPKVLRNRKTGALNATGMNTFSTDDIEVNKG
jgi:hypothetical protein